MTNKFNELLEATYKEELDINNDLSKLEFVGEWVFDFTTYENEFIRKLTTQAILVANNITNCTTFKLYNEDPETYLTMVNMPFFKYRVEWGVSIRGAWWEKRNTADVFFSSRLFSNQQGEQVDLEVIGNEIKDFIDAINNFVKEEIDA